MSGTATVLAVDSVTVSTSDPLVGAVLEQIVQATASISGADVAVLTAASISIPAAPQDGKPHLLVVQGFGATTLGSDSVTVLGGSPADIPVGWNYVVASPGQPLAGDAGGVIVGDDLDYLGAAGTVLGTASATEPAGLIGDSADNAQLYFAPSGTTTTTSGGQQVPSDEVFTTGTGATIDMAAGVLGIVSAVGAANDIVVGGVKGRTVVAPERDTISGGPFGIFGGPIGVRFPVDSDLIFAGGGSDTVQLQRAVGTVLATGANALVELGTATGTAAAAADVATAVLAPTAAGSVDTVQSASGNNLVYATGATELDATGGNDTIGLSQDGVVTVNATGGSQVIFDNGGGNLIHGGAATGFYSGAAGAAASTLIGGGADTVFTASALDYDGSAATSLFLAAGAGAVSVIGAANNIVFGGSGGGLYQIGAGTGTTQGMLFVAGGGDDTVAGTASVFAFGHAGEDLTVSQTAGRLSSFAGKVPGGDYVTHGEAETINAADAAGGNVFFVSNSTVGGTAGASFTGDTTLVGSSDGHDLFALFVDASQPTPHTITIDNWQATDALFLNNLADASDRLNAADTAAVSGFNAGSASSFTLSDGTTVDFAGGARPSNLAHA